MPSTSAENHNNQTLEVGSVISAESRRLHVVYRSKEQERVNYLEARLVEVMTEIESVRADNERMTIALDERDDQLSKSRAELIQAYKTSIQIRADMLDLLQKLQPFDLEEEDLHTQRSEDEQSIVL